MFMLNNYELVIRQLLGSCQAVVKLPLGSYQAVIRQSSGSQKSVRFHLLRSLLEFSGLFKNIKSIYGKVKTRSGKNSVIKIHSKQDINSQKLTLWRAKKH